MIKAVFFDAIDTLFCAYPTKIEMYIRVIEKHTGIKVSKEKMLEVWDQVYNETEEKAKIATNNNECSLIWEGFNEKILKLVGFKGNISEVGKILHYESWFNPENYILYEDVMPTLELLKKMNIYIACVSNQDDGLNNFFIHFNIEKYFDFVMVSEVVGCEKPNPEIFRLALDKADLKADEVIFVGDSLISDYEGSQNAGMNPILIDRNDKVDDNKITKINNLQDIATKLKGVKSESTTS